jgi:hypothetical protein
VDISSAPQFDAAGGGTLTCSSVINYLANMGCQAGATITTYRGFVAQNINGNTGAVTNLINVDLPLNTLGGTVNNAIRIGSGSPTINAALPLNSNQIDIWPGTVQLAYANSGLLAPFINASGTIQCNTTASVLGIFLTGLVNFATTFKNQPTVANNLSAVVGFRAAPIFQADGASISVGTVSTTAMFRAFPQTNVINAGTISGITLTNFSSNLSVGASTTVTQMTHFIANAAANSGTLTTEIGLDVGALVGATAIGIRNASTTLYTPTASQTLAAGTTVQANATHIQVIQTSGANITLTAQPTISSGQSGQLLVITNISTVAGSSFTFQSSSSLALGLLSLGATTRVVGVKGSLTLIYNSTLSRWVEIGFNGGTFG